MAQKIDLEEEILTVLRRDPKDSFSARQVAFYVYGGDLQTDDNGNSRRVRQVASKLREMSANRKKGKVIYLGSGHAEHSHFYRARV